MQTCVAGTCDDFPRPIDGAESLIDRWSRQLTRDDSISSGFDFGTSRESKRIEMLGLVGHLRRAGKKTVARLSAQFSGGCGAACLMIAMALSCETELLIADETVRPRCDGHDSGADHGTCLPIYSKTQGHRDLPDHTRPRGLRWACAEPCVVMYAVQAGSSSEPHVANVCFRVASSPLHDRFARFVADVEINRDGAAASDSPANRGPVRADRRFRFVSVAEFRWNVAITDDSGASPTDRPERKIGFNNQFEQPEKTTRQLIGHWGGLPRGAFARMIEVFERVAVERKQCRMSRYLACVI